jgi:hypothetical protein
MHVGILVAIELLINEADLLQAWENLKSEMLPFNWIVHEVTVFKYSDIIEED